MTYADGDGPGICDWCGEFEDTAGPLEGVLCNDGSTMWLCEDCLEGNCND
jgi:hypothetical protein